MALGIEGAFMVFFLLFHRYLFVAPRLLPRSAMVLFYLHARSLERDHPHCPIQDSNLLKGIRTNSGNNGWGRVAVILEDCGSSDSGSNPGPGPLTFFHGINARLREFQGAPV